MTAPAAFAVFAAALAVLLLAFTRASSRALDRAVIVGVDDPDHADSSPDTDSPKSGAHPIESGPEAGPESESGPAAPAEPGFTPGPTPDPDPTRESAAEAPPMADRAPELEPRPRLTTRALLWNVAASQALFLGVLAAGAWLADLPRSMLGLAPGALGGQSILIGLLIGGGLAAANGAVGRAADRVGAATPERLRAALMPESAAEWALLLGVVLPTIAVFEELLFRAALIGVPAAGLGLSPWLLAVASSVVFGLGHVAQGRLGVAVAAGLGLALAALFLATGSLAAVVVAHYVVNAAEFLVHGRPGAGG